MFRQGGALSCALTDRITFSYFNHKVSAVRVYEFALLWSSKTVYHQEVL